MNWEDEGYLLSKKKFRENAVIINVFTQGKKVKEEKEKFIIKNNI